MVRARPALLAGSLALLACLAVPGCGGGGEGDGPPVVVGSKAFTESILLGEIVSALARSAGARVEHKASLGDTSKTWNGLLLGQLDVYCEYTGTLLKEVLADKGLKSDEELRAYLLREHGLVMSGPIGFSNSYALGMREKQAEALGITNISDLRGHPGLRLGLSTPFLPRPDGWTGLKPHYRLPFRTPNGIEHSLAYRGIETGTLDVIDVYTTDAEVRRYKLRVLEDDRKFFPAYDAVVLYRADLAERAPQVVEALRRLEGAIDAPTMRELNYRAVVEGVPEPRVAADFLRETGLDVEVDLPTLGERIAWRTWQHLRMVVVSLALAILTAVPLGVVAAHRPRLGQVILAVVGMAQTLPALALLGFLLVILANLHLPAVGPTPAIVALYVYSLLPILRNTYTGLHDIPLSLRESAEALGLSAFPRLYLVELPMASRSILAGVKTAAVINVGFATLGGLIAAGGYGQPIIAGLNKNDNYLILEGAVPAMALALAIQGLFELAERFLVPKGLRLRAAQ